MNVHAICRNSSTVQNSYVCIKADQMGHTNLMCTDLSLGDAESLLIFKPQPPANPAALTSHTSGYHTSTMGNTNTSCQLSNYSKRNVRVFVTEKAMQMEALIVSESGPIDKLTNSVLPLDKKFTFKKDVKCIRVLASQTQEVPWEADHFVSVFVEGDDDENICSRQIIHNMALSAPVTVLLYDV